jgi:hypothetical protein
MDYKAIMRKVRNCSNTTRGMTNYEYLTRLGFTPKELGITVNFPFERVINYQGE